MYIYIHVYTHSHKQTYIHTQHHTNAYTCIHLQALKYEKVDSYKECLIVIPIFDDIKAKDIEIEVCMYVFMYICIDI
jgi:hypothetical protein